MKRPDDVAHTLEPSPDSPSPGGTRGESNAPLDYGIVGDSASTRSWAWAFLLSGGYALACIPAVLLFEHLRWPEDVLHVTSFFACILCAVSAARHLWAVRGGGGGAVPVGGGVVRALAWAAVALTLGFLMFCAFVVWQLAGTMNKF